MRESTRFMSLSTPIVILEPPARGIGDLLPSVAIRKEGTTVVGELLLLREKVAWRSHDG